MSRRRSLRHHLLISAGSGALAITIAATHLNPVWLAVAPLLLVIADTLASSPTLRAAAQTAGHRISALAPSDPPAVAEARQVLYAPASVSRAAPLGAAVTVITIALVIVFRGPVWSFVSAHVLPLVVAVGVAALTTLVRFLLFARPAVHSLADIMARVDSAVRAPAPESRPAPTAAGDAGVLAWLDRRLTASAVLPLSVVVLAFDGSPQTLVDIAIALAPARVQVQSLSSAELLLVGTARDIQSAMRLVTARVSVGEAVYPREGRSPGGLIATARGRLSRRRA